MTGETVMLSDMKTSSNLNEKSFFFLRWKAKHKKNYSD